MFSLINGELLLTGQGILGMCYKCLVENCLRDRWQAARLQGTPVR